MQTVRQMESTDPMRKKMVLLSHRNQIRLSIHFQFQIEWMIQQELNQLWKKESMSPPFESPSPFEILSPFEIP